MDHANGKIHGSLTRTEIKQSEGWGMYWPRRSVGGLDGLGLGLDGGPLKVLLTDADRQKRLSSDFKLSRGPMGTLHRGPEFLLAALTESMIGSFVNIYKLSKNV